MKVTLDRKGIRWRGPHMPTLRKAIKTGEPAFKMEPPEPTNATCPVCGRRFWTKPSGPHTCCSLSCAAKLNWIRRKA